MDNVQILDTTWHDGVKSNLCHLSKEAFKTQVHPTLSCLFSLHMDVLAFPLPFSHTRTHTHTHTHTLCCFYRHRQLSSASSTHAFPTCCLTLKCLLLCLDFQDRSFFQRSAPLHPHLQELWIREHQGLLHRPEGRILRGTAFWKETIEPVWVYSTSSENIKYLTRYVMIYSLPCWCKVGLNLVVHLSFSLCAPQAHRHEVTICNYEASANPADHKVESIIPQTNFISWELQRVGKKRRAKVEEKERFLWCLLDRYQKVKDESNAANWQVDWPRPEAEHENLKSGELQRCLEDVVLFSIAIKGEGLMWAKSLIITAWNIRHSDIFCCYQFNLYTLILV